MRTKYEDLRELDDYQLENSEQDLRGHSLTTSDGLHLGTIKRMLVDPDRDPLTDRGFWIENDGARMFALIIDQPVERPKDINPGATLRIDGGTIRNASEISAEGIEGDALDQNTMDAIADQQAVLLVDEANITIEDEA